VSVKDRAILAKMASFELCIDRMSGLCGAVSRLAFVTTMSNHASLLRVVLLLLEGE
jgi:hypothetical protein